MGKYRLCRYCVHMVGFGDEGSMYCKHGLSKSDESAMTCKFYVLFANSIEEKETSGAFLCPYCDSPLDDSYYCDKCRKDFKKEAEHSKDGTLTYEQLAQQDKIDNACFGLIKEFYPEAKWNIEVISTIREALIDVLVKYYWIKEYDIYPYLLEETPK